MTQRFPTTGYPMLTDKVRGRKAGSMHFLFNHGQKGKKVALKLVDDQLVQGTFPTAHAGTFLKMTNIALVVVVVVVVILIVVKTTNNMAGASSSPSSGSSGSNSSNNNNDEGEALALWVEQALIDTVCLWCYRVTFQLVGCAAVILYFSDDSGLWLYPGSVSILSFVTAQFLSPTAHMSVTLAWLAFIVTLISIARL